MIFILRKSKHIMVSSRVGKLENIKVAELENTFYSTQWDLKRYAVELFSLVFSSTFLAMI